MRIIHKPVLLMEKSWMIWANMAPIIHSCSILVHRVISRKQIMVKECRPGIRSIFVK